MFTLKIGVYWSEVEFANWSSQHMLSNGAVHSGQTELNWPSCVKLTQLHDALLVTRVSITKLIGCKTARRALQFSSVQFSSSAVNTALHVTLCPIHTTRQTDTTQHCLVVSGLDTTRRSCLCRVRHCESSLETVWQSPNSQPIDHPRHVAFSEEV